MTSEDIPAAESPAVSRRLTLASRPRRPWLLIAAALLLAVLSVVLWAKWRDTRARAEQLQAELKQVYMEAESLRTQAARAQQRMIQLERELRALSAGEGARNLPRRPSP
jgi:type VI protein secretion system component VasK